MKMSIVAGNRLTTPSGAKVPPAWTNVWMTNDPKSPVQATGRDSKGRRVYLYSVEHAGRAAAAKFSRLKAFAKVYPSLIRKIAVDKKHSEEALVLYLISKTGFRIGSDAETLAEVKAFGASTLRCSHVAVKGNRVSFDFTGKKGSRVNKVLRDGFLAGNISKRCFTGTDKRLFKTTDDNIRDYLNSIPAAAGFSVKDFRTYRATIIALHKIGTMDIPENGRQYKSYRIKVGEAVAKELGNTPRIALKSYVSPEVFCSWATGAALESKDTKTKPGFAANEFVQCIHYDQDVSMEESRDTDPLERLG
jgi:DNA topoisomerase I